MAEYWGKKLKIVLEMIKFEHTIFALPFAYLGAFLAARGVPHWRICFWILLAMVGARSAAMAFNRYADRDLDSGNPRTSGRALPRKQLTPRFVIVFTAFSSLLFLISAWQLNPLALKLAPLALAIVFAYSYTKRFTSASHVFLGLSLAVAPVGGWVAVRGSLDPVIFLLAAAVLFWVGGFDIIYSCQDLEFDRRRRLYSLPSRHGVHTSLIISAAFHIVMVGLLIGTFYILHLSTLSWIGLALVAAVLIYEHSLVSADDLNRVNAAFFTMNGIVSILLFVFVGADLCLAA